MQPYRTTLIMIDALAVWHRRVYAHQVTPARQACQAPTGIIASQPDLMPMYFNPHPLQLEDTTSY